MKRYLIPIVTILVLILAVIGGCSQNPEQIQELSPRGALPPKVIEKDVDVSSKTEPLSFYLKVGDRVEGEVTLTQVEWQARQSPVPLYNLNQVMSEVEDPYGQVIRRRSIDKKTGHYYPWKFAFIAATNGEYQLVTFIDGGTDLFRIAHLKVIVYEDD